MSHGKFIRDLLIAEVERLRDVIEEKEERLRWLREDNEELLERKQLLEDDIRNLKYDLATARLGNNDFDSVVQQVYDRDPLQYQINKILFIKQVREETHLGLKEAKDLVDKFLANLPDEASDEAAG